MWTSYRSARNRICIALFVAAVNAVMGIALWGGAVTNRLIDQTYATIALGGILFMSLVHVLTVTIQIGKDARYEAALERHNRLADEEARPSTTRREKDRRRYKASPHR